MVDRLELDAPRTKKMVQLLKTLGIHESCLVVAKDDNHVLWKSVRNIPGMALMPASQLNAYEVLKRKRLLITKDQLNSIQ